MKKTRISFAKLKKASANEVILTLMFMCIGIGCIFFGQYTVNSNELENAARGFYSPLAFGVYAWSEDNAKTDVVPQIEKYVKANPGVAVYSPDKLSIYIVKVCFNGSVYVPPIISGRYFEPEDFFCGKALCVIGKNYTPSSADSLETIDGTDYLVKAGVKYQVIGRMGFSVASDLNNSAILNLDAEPLVMQKRYNPALIVDSNFRRAVNTARTEFPAVLNEVKVLTNLTEVPNPSMSVTEFFNVDLLSLMMILFGAFAIVLSTVPLTLMWVNKRRRRVAVQRLLGFSSGLVLAQMMGRLMVLFHIGFILGFALYNVVAKIAYLATQQLFSMQVLVAYVGALVFNLLISVVPFVQTMKIEPGDALRKA